MHFRSGGSFSFFSAFRARFQRLFADRGGNFALTFALVSVPMLLGVGVSIDYARAYNVKVKMQSDLDAALIASIKDVDSLDEDEIKEKVTKWFTAQADTVDASYVLSTASISVSKSDRTVTAIATGIVPTTIMGLANINSVNVSVASSVAGPATSYLNVYFVIDKSPSMLLAAHGADQTMLRNDKNITCEFACHSTDDPVYKNGNNKNKILASTYYNYIKSTYGTELRSDVAVKAVKEVLDLIDEADAQHSRIKVGLYKLGTTTNEVLEPTFSTSTAEKYLDDDEYGLTSSSSEAGTYFDQALPKLQDLVGTAGDGSSEKSPLKLVLLLTDGVQSERNWVLWWNKPTYDVLGWADTQSNATKQDIWKVVTPLNPSWCSGMKTNGATLGVLYTQYLPITSDWGYNATVGKSMSSSKFTTLWGGKLRAGVSGSTTRQDYIPYALQDCATSEDMFISASDPDAIEQGLSSLFQQYLGAVRLTQ